MYFQNDEKTLENSKYFQPTENTIYNGDYFFIVKQVVKDRKTPLYHIFEHNTNYIGEIKWYGPWRKFCFYPDKDTIWDNKCLTEVVNFLVKLNKDYYNKK